MKNEERKDKKAVVAEIAKVRAGYLPPNSCEFGYK